MQVGRWALGDDLSGQYLNGKSNRGREHQECVDGSRVAIEETGPRILATAML